MSTPSLPGVFFGDATPETLAYMDRITQEWTLRAARGECPWVCADCCVTFPEGMPDECAHGQQRCTDIIKRDKKYAHANKEAS